MSNTTDTPILTEVLHRLDCLIDSWSSHIKNTEPAVTQAYERCIKDLKGLMLHKDIPFKDRDYLK